MKGFLGKIAFSALLIANVPRAMAMQGAPFSFAALARANTPTQKAIETRLRLPSVAQLEQPHTPTNQQESQEVRDARWMAVFYAGKQLYQQPRNGTLLEIQRRDTQAFALFNQASRQEESLSARLMGFFGKGVLLYRGHGTTRNIPAARLSLMFIATLDEQINSRIDADTRVMARYLAGTILYDEFYANKISPQNQLLMWTFFEDTAHNPHASTRVKQLANAYLTKLDRCMDLAHRNHL